MYLRLATCVWTLRDLDGVKNSTDPCHGYLAVSLSNHSDIFNTFKVRACIKVGGGGSSGSRRPIAGCPDSLNLWPNCNPKCLASNLLGLVGSETCVLVPTCSAEYSHSLYYFEWLLLVEFTSKWCDTHYDLRMGWGGGCLSAYKCTPCECKEQPPNPLVHTAGSIASICM